MQINFSEHITAIYMTLYDPITGTVLIKYSYLNLNVWLSVRSAKMLIKAQNIIGAWYVNLFGW